VLEWILKGINALRMIAGVRSDISHIISIGFSSPAMDPFTSRFGLSLRLVLTYEVTREMNYK
jgi:hypothetical protein